MNENMNDTLNLLFADLNMTDRQIFDTLGYTHNGALKFDPELDLTPAEMRAGAIEVQLDDLLIFAHTPIEHAVAATVNLLYRHLC